MYASEIPRRLEPGFSPNKIKPLAALSERSSFPSFLDRSKKEGRRRPSKRSEKPIGRIILKCTARIPEDSRRTPHDRTENLRRPIPGPANSPGERVLDPKLNRRVLYQSMFSGIPGKPPALVRIDFERHESPVLATGKDAILFSQGHELWRISTSNV